MVQAPEGQTTHKRRVIDFVTYPDKIVNHQQKRKKEKTE